MKFSQYTKLSVICNICFLITFFNHFKPILTNSEWHLNIIVLGQIAAVFLTLGYFIWLLFYCKKNKLNKEQVVLFIAQVIFFATQIYYLFFF